MPTVQNMAAQLPEGDAIPLNLVRKLVNDHLSRWSVSALSYLVESGAVVPLPHKHGDGNRHMIDRDQAVFILAAAVAAREVQVPVVTMVRGLQAAGITPADITEILGV